MADDPNVPGPAAERPRATWRRRVLVLMALGLGTCLAVALFRPLAVLIGGSRLTSGEEPLWEYESTAILEVSDNRPAVEASPVNVAAELPTLRVRLVSWNSIREAILSRKVDFGRDIDPDDRRAIERVYHSVSRRIRVAALGPRHIAVSHRSRSPELNAALVNELVKRFVAQEREVAQQSAKTALKYYRDKLAGAWARLTEVDTQIREFMQANPRLRDNLSDLQTEYKEAEEQERDLTAKIADSETEIVQLKKNLARVKPEVTVKRERQYSEEDKARWAWRYLKDYLGALGDLERATNAKAAENLARLGEALSRVQEVQKLAVEAIEARKAIELLETYVWKVNDRNKGPDGNYEEVVRRLDEAMAALPQLQKLAQQDVTEDTQPNPRHEQLLERLSAAEKEIGRLQARRLAANKRVSELHVLVRPAPELMARKRRLDEERAAHAASVEDYARYMRAAEREFERLVTEAYSSRFRVVEYAQPEWTPAEDQGSSGEPARPAPGTAATEARAAQGTDIPAMVLCGLLGILAGASPFLVMRLRARASSQAAEAAPAAPRRRGALRLALVGLACILLPLLIVIGAIVLYPPYPRLGTPSIAGEEVVKGTSAATEFDKSP